MRRIVPPPKTLRISRSVAEYVQEMLLGGASPEDIGRGVDKMYGRESFAYFMVPSPEGWVFAPADYEIDGLAYIDASLRRLGGYLPVIFGWARYKDRWHRVVGDGHYAFNPDHPMIKYIAPIGANAALPGGKNGTTEEGY